MELKKGIIVSIQGYSKETTSELAREAVSAGAVAIRTDKRVEVGSGVLVIGLHKIKVSNREEDAYITPTVADVEAVARWADLVAVDCRQINKNLSDVADYCHANKVRIVADISSLEDLSNLKEIGLEYDYVTTALTVFRKRNWPDKRLAKKLSKEEPGRVIAEGNYRTRGDVEEVFRYGVQAVCIGAAISDVYKLTRKFTSAVPGGDK